MIKCINCEYCRAGVACYDSVIVFGTECLKYGVFAGKPEELKAKVIHKHDKPCEYAK